MGLSDLDGFLTGIVVGPEMIMPSEWMPVIWGGTEPEFETPEEARSIIGTIMARYNEIIAALEAVPNEFDPVFWEGPNGQVIVTDWAAGFLDAAQLRPTAWEPLIRHRRAGVLIVPLLVLGADDPDHPPFGHRALPKAEIGRLHAEGAEIIPDCVIGIHAFWREHSARSGAGGGPRLAKPAPRRGRR